MAATPGATLLGGPVDYRVAFGRVMDTQVVGSYNTVEFPLGPDHLCINHMNRTRLLSSRSNNESSY